MLESRLARTVYFDLGLDFLSPGTSRAASVFSDAFHMLFTSLLSMVCHDERTGNGAKPAANKVSARRIKH